MTLEGIDNQIATTLLQLTRAGVPWQLDDDNSGTYVFPVTRKFRYALTPYDHCRERNGSLTEYRDGYVRRLNVDAEELSKAVRVNLDEQRKSLAQTALIELNGAKPLGGGK